MMSLPGDTPELVDALHALSAAGLLPPNHIADGHQIVHGVVVFDTRAAQRFAPCPRCGRDTAIERNQPPTVCTGCRADYWRFA